MQKPGISMDDPVRTMSRAVLSLAFVTAVFVFVNRGTGHAGEIAPSQAAFDAPEVRPTSDVVPPKPCCTGLTANWAQPSEPSRS